MIYKSKWGGYYSGDKRENEDIPLVRQAPVSEVYETLHLLDPHAQINKHQIELVLMTLKELTPDGTHKDWKEIHNGI